MENQETITPRGYFRALRTMYNFFLVGQLVMAVVGIVIITLNIGTQVDSNFHNILLVIGLIYATFYIFKRIRSKNQGLDLVKQEKNLLAKLNLYRAYLVKNWSSVVGGSFFMIICGMVSSDYKFYIFLALFILIFLFDWKPKVETAIRDLSLNKEEENILRNPDAVII